MKRNISYNQKDIEFYQLGRVFREAVGLPGLAVGYSHIIKDLTEFETKSFLYEIYFAGIEKGSVTVIIDIGNSIDWKSLVSVGLKVIDANNNLANEDVGAENIAKYNIDYSENIEEVVNNLSVLIQNLTSGNSLDATFSESQKFFHNLNIVVVGDRLLDGICNLYSKKDNDSEFALNNFAHVLNHNIAKSRNQESEYNFTFILIDVNRNKIKNEVLSINNDIFLKSIKKSFGTLIQSKRDDKLKQELCVYNFKKSVTIGNITRLASIINDLRGGYGQILLEGEALATPHGFIQNTISSIEIYKKDYFKHYSYTLKWPYLEIGIKD